MINKSKTRNKDTLVGADEIGAKHGLFQDHNGQNNNSGGSEKLTDPKREWRKNNSNFFVSISLFFVDTNHKLVTYKY